ncbi:MAG: hypothetical protein HY076_05840, partial [Candidatus Eisenbacteria bacterium]|nr:hypothetical protein [Candidatus Eisenbacteria bacterium]
IDGGARWRPLRNNRPGLIADLKKPDGQVRGALPLVPITDLVIHGSDLVAATQGRAFWILDDVSPLRQMTADAAAEDAHLFQPAPAYMFGGPGGGNRTTGANPPAGAVIYYRLAAEPKDKEEVTLEFLDAKGKLIRKFSSKGDASDEGDAAGGDEEGGFGRGGGSPRKIPARAGLNRFAWDFHYPDAARFKGLILWGGGLNGPTVVPGEYQVRLTVNGRSQTQPFEVRKDPRVATSLADYQKRFDLHMKIHDKLTETHEAITRLRDVKDQLKSVADRSKQMNAKDSTIAAASRTLSEKLTRVEEALYQTKNRSSQDPLNYPIRLNNKLSQLTGVVAGADAAPTDQAYAVYNDVAGRIDAELTRLKGLLGDDLAAFNRLVKEKDVPAVLVKEKRERGAGAAAATGETPADEPDPDEPHR